MKEHKQIVNASKKWLEEQGYSVYGPLKLGEFIADVVGVKERDDVIAIEIKPGNMSEIRKGLGQAQTYLDYVHKVFLAIPMTYVDVGEKIAKHTRIGLITNKKFISLSKDAEYTKPLEENLIYVLSKTTGFCWICGRTFNTVPKNEDSIYMAHKDIDKKLYKSLVRTLRQKPSTKGYWVHICIVCSKIMYHISAEFLRKLIFGKTKYSKFKFETFWYDDIREFFEIKKDGPSIKP